MEEVAEDGKNGELTCGSRGERERTEKDN